MAKKRHIRIEQDEIDWFLDADGELICPECAFESQREADKMAEEGEEYLFKNELPHARVHAVLSYEYCTECNTLAENSPEE